MRDSTATPDSPAQPPNASASHRLEERWNRRLAWSLSLAVLLHAAVFVLGPRWPVLDRPASSEAGEPASGAIAVTRLLPSGGVPGRAARGTPVAERPDTAAEESGTATSRAGEDGGGSAGAGRGEDLTQEELWERLDGAPGPRLSLTAPSGREPGAADPEPGPREEAPRSPGAGPESLSIGGRAATVEARAEPEGDSLGLGRLRSLEPEVVTGLGSAEILLRNPGEVTRFRESAARRRPAVASTRAHVGVAVWVDRSGSVEWAEVSESTGHPALDEVALTLFRDVVAFRPAVEDGKRVPKSMLFYILFPW